MRRSAVFLLLCAITACGQDTKIRNAREQEATEIAACRTTYPVGKSQFAPLINCENAAAAAFVQQIDPAENDAEQRIASELQRLAADVDAGRMSIQDWQAQASNRVHLLKDARRTAEANTAFM